MSQTANAYLEIIEQILGEFHAVENATPDWLVDSNTGRRFKVDRLYPELGIAIRFKGILDQSGKSALDEIELMEETGRDETRARLCRQADIALVMLNVEENTPSKTLNEIHTALSAAARRIAQRRVAQRSKLDLLPRIASAKIKCRRILSEISSPKGILSLAQAWENRQFAPKNKAPTGYQPGMAVKHPEYGRGLVLRVVPGGEKEETEIVVQFSDDSIHTWGLEQANRELRIGK